MALPTSGQLTFEQIGTELSIGTAGPQSMRSMSSTAGKSVPDSTYEFYGYSHVTAPTSAPTSINGTQDTLECNPSDWVISWNHVSGATGYKISYRIGTGSWSTEHLDSASPGSRTITSTLNSGDSVDWRVRGYNSAGNGPYGYDYNGSNVECIGNEK